MINKKKLFFTVDEVKNLLPIEQHIHTKATDGKNTIEEIVKYAIKKKYWQIAFTEHVQRKSNWYKEFINELNELKIIYKDKINIITGLEAKQVNSIGDIDATDKQISLAEIIMGSVHGYCKKGEYKFCERKNLKDEEALNMELSQTIALIKNSKNTKINVIGHPFGKYIKYFSDDVPRDYWEKIIKEITINNLAFDLNYHYHYKYFKTIIFLCKKYKTKLNIGSDVHKLSMFGKGYYYFKKII